MELSGTDSSGSAVRIGGNLIPNSRFEVGPILQYRLPRGDVESYLVEFSCEYNKSLTLDLDLGVTLGSTWASQDYNSTYFGVSSADARRSGLSTFRAGSAFKYIGGKVKLGFGPDSWGPWKIIGTFGYFRLIGHAADSPVVARAGDENQVFAGVALGYQN